MTSKLTDKGNRNANPKLVGTMTDLNSAKPNPLKFQSSRISCNVRERTSVDESDDDIRLVNDVIPVGVAVAAAVVVVPCGDFVFGDAACKLLNHIRRRLGGRKY